MIGVSRTGRRRRRSKGGSDALDAAAGAVLAGRACVLSKGRRWGRCIDLGGASEYGGAPMVARSSTHKTRGCGVVKARTVCINELRALPVAASA